MCCPDLLEQLPALQQLLSRLINCQPEGAASGNYLIQYALALVLKESFKIYCAINDGLINLVNLFFEMSKFDAVKALEIYKRSSQQSKGLAEFYDFCKALDLARNFQFPTLRQPPPTFLATMEEYMKEAPRVGSCSSKNLEYEEKKLLTYKAEEEEEEAPPETEELPTEEEREPISQTEEPQTPDLITEPETEPEPIPSTTGDLLGLLDEINPVAAEIEQNNALALAILQPGDGLKPSTSMDLIVNGSSGWELALVTTPSSNTNHVVESKLGGGFDKLLLESLYEDTARRQQIASVGYYGGVESAANPFDNRDPFATSNNICPPSNVQMAQMAQQQQYYYQQQLQQQQYYQQQHQYYQPQQQQMMMMPYNPQLQNASPQQLGTTVANPFSDPFAGLTGFAQSAPHPPQGNSSSLL